MEGLDPRVEPRSFAELPDCGCAAHQSFEQLAVQLGEARRQMRLWNVLVDKAAVLSDFRSGTGEQRRCEDDQPEPEPGECAIPAVLAGGGWLSSVKARGKHGLPKSG